MDSVGDAEEAKEHINKSQQDLETSKSSTSPLEIDNDEPPYSKNDMEISYKRHLKSNK